MAVDIKQLATRKIGPLPAWVWIAAIVGGIFAARMLRGSGEETLEYADDEIGDPSRPIDDPGPAGSDVTLPSNPGGGREPGSDQPIYLPSDPVQMPASGYSAEPPWWLDPAYVAAVYPSPTPTSPEVRSEPEPQTPTVANQPPAIAAVQRQQSFEWGGRIWTRGDLPAFKNWLKSRGTTFETWSANHAKASQDVFGVKAAAPATAPVTQPKPPAQPVAGGGAPTTSAAVHAMPAPSVMASLDTNIATAIRNEQAKAKPAPAKVATAPRYYTYKKDVPLGPGQSLKFTSGKGYYAG